MIFWCYASFEDFDNGISDFRENYRASRPEIGLYVLVSSLWSCREKDLVLKVINEAEKSGIKPRQSLLDLKGKIEKEGVLPKYI
jgi:hypothetical protein